MAIPSALASIQRTKVPATTNNSITAVVDSCFIFQTSASFLSNVFHRSFLLGFMPEKDVPVAGSVNEQQNSVGVVNFYQLSSLLYAGIRVVLSYPRWQFSIQVLRSPLRKLQLSSLQRHRREDSVEHVSVGWGGITATEVNDYVLHYMLVTFVHWSGSRKEWKKLLVLSSGLSSRNFDVSAQHVPHVGFEIVLSAPWCDYKIYT